MWTYRWFNGYQPLQIDKHSVCTTERVICWSIRGTVKSWHNQIVLIIFHTYAKYNKYLILIHSGDIWSIPIYIHHQDKWWPGDVCLLTILYHLDKERWLIIIEGLIKDHALQTYEIQTSTLRLDQVWSNVGCLAMLLITKHTNTLNQHISLSSDVKMTTMASEGNHLQNTPPSTAWSQ